MKHFYLIYFSFVTFSGIAQKAELIQNMGHSSEITDIAISLDGKYMLSSDYDGIAKLWNKELAKEIRTFTCGGSKKIFSHNGKSFFSFNEKQVIQWDLETGFKRAVFEGSKSIIKAINLSADGQNLIIGNMKGEVLIFSISDSKNFRTIPPKIKIDHDYCFAFSPFNNRVIYGDFYIYKIFKPEVWDYENENLLYTLKTDGEIYELAFSPDKKYIAAAVSKSLSVCDGQQYLQIFDATNGNLLSETSTSIGEPNVEAMVYSLEFDSKSDNVIIATRCHISKYNIASKEKSIIYSSHLTNVEYNPSDNNILLYEDAKFFYINPENGTTIKAYNSFSDYINTCQISNNGSIIATGNSKEIKLFNLETGRKINTIKGDFLFLQNIFFNSNNEKIAVVLGQVFVNDTLIVKIFDISTGQEIKCFRKYTENPNSFAMNSSLSDIVVNYGDLKSGRIESYSVETGLLNFSKSDLKNIVTSACFIEDDSKILISVDKSCKILNSTTGAELNNFSLANYRGIENKTFGNKPEILSHSFKGNVCELILWDYKTGKTIKKIDNIGYPAHISALSPDNTTIVSFAKFPILYNVQHIDIWDAISGKLKGKIEFTTGCVNIYFSKKGDKIYTINYAGEIAIWDTQSLIKIGGLVSTAGQGLVSYTANGQFDGNQEGIRYLHFVKGLDIIPLESLYEQYYTPNLFERVFGGENSSGSLVEVVKLSPAPYVRILIPSNLTNVSNAIVSVTVQATDKGGGIDEIRLYHNGKLLDGTTRGFKNTGQDHEFTITLTNGENRIKATAFNSQRTESIPDEIVVNYKAPEIAKPNMHILAVGINNYLNPKYNLNYAKNDAEAFVKSLSAGASSLFGKVEVTTLSDANATKAGILSAIEKVKSTANAEDVFVFYYAGHGVMSSGTGIEMPQFYLVPTDVTKMYEADEMLKKLGISATEIGEFSKTIKAQKQLFVIDACQSGGAMQTLAMRGAAEEKAIAQLARSTGTYFIAASGSEQFATEVAELGHGIFTYSVIEALKGSCKSQDGKVTVNILKSCVEDLVPELSKKHKGQPQFPTGYGFGMDFPVVMVK